jgi:pimeloyl-ACP methyl ester carboxylesterase
VRQARLKECPTVCFSHGQESGPWGTKIAAMAEPVRALGWGVDSIDYRGIESSVDRTDKLAEHCRGLQGEIILVGSSMGGHVAAAASTQIPTIGLFLIAPAFYMPGCEEHTPVPDAPKICVVHGWRDDIVPIANSIRWASLYGAELHALDGDHRLTDRLDDILTLFDWFLEKVPRTQ